MNPQGEDFGCLEKLYGVWGILREGERDPSELESAQFTISVTVTVTNDMWQGLLGNTNFMRVTNMTSD